MTVSARPGDELTVAVIYEDGSRLNLVATTQGNPIRGLQEYIDMRRGNLRVTIDDLLVMTVQERGHRRVLRSIIRDKGHTRIYRDFSRRVGNGANPSYPERDLLISSKVHCLKEGGGAVLFSVNEKYPS